MARKDPPKPTRSTSESGASENQPKGTTPKTPEVPVLRPVYSDWALI